jgi:hypothetical protein
MTTRPSPFIVSSITPGGSLCTTSDPPFFEDPSHGLPNGVQAEAKGLPDPSHIGMRVLEPTRWAASCGSYLAR